MMARILWLVACTACNEPFGLGERSMSIVSGEADPGHPEVVHLDRGDLGACTGTLVDPRTVLTAGHCIGGIVRVQIGPDPSVPEGTLAIRDQVAHPAYSADPLENDIGLVRLAEDAPAAIRPARLWRDDLESDVVGATVRVVGYGASSDQPGPLIKNQGTSLVVAVTDRRFRIEPDPSLPCLGDSGGPAFLGDGAQEIVIGVTSAGDPACESHSWDTRVDTYLETFIDPFLAAATQELGDRCFLDDNCSSGVCSAEWLHCTAPCDDDADCSSTTYCGEAASDGERLCLRGAPVARGGCSSTSHAPAGAGALFLLLLCRRLGFSRRREASES